MTRYEHTQTGYVLICGLFVAAFAFAFARFFQTSPQREIFLVVSILFLITIVAFYKLTITIDDQILCASFGVGLVRKKVALAEIAACEPLGNSSHAIRLAVQRRGIRRGGDHVA